MDRLINQAIDFSPSAKRSLVHYAFLVFGAVFYLCSILIFVKFLRLIFQNNFIKYAQANQTYLIIIFLAIIVHFCIALAPVRVLRVFALLVIVTAFRALALLVLALLGLGAL